MIDRDFDEAASEAAFTVTSAVLHRLRPRLRSVVPDDALGHPAYADNNFPIWWQHQNNDQFIKQAKPPFFVRYSHHPLNVYRGVFKGHAAIQCYAHTEPWVGALRDLVVAAYPVGEVASHNGYEVTFREAESKGAWPVSGWDRSKDWPIKADFMIPVSVFWTTPVAD